jgi:predicted component of type VI protein secretion system
MSPGRLLLEVVAGNALGSQIEVETDFLIGRQAPGAGTLADDYEISREHARISRAAGGDFMIEDLASTNGTFVNGARIAAPQRLAEGDRVEVGGTTLMVHTPAESAPAQQSTAARAVPAHPAEQPARAPAGIPALSLRIDIDLVGCEATLSLGDGSDAVRLEYADGGWRIAP